MEIVINTCYGGFNISDEAREILGEDFDVDADSARTDKNLIDLIKKEGSQFVSSEFSELTIVDIGDNFTDYKIKEYDGLEEVIAVIDGKIVHFFE